MSSNSQDVKAAVPDTLDGARVLFTARAAPGQFGQVQSTGEPVQIMYFVIATYSEHEPGVYLFGVSPAHEVVCDYDCESADDAMHTARASGFTEYEFHRRVD